MRRIRVIPTLLIRNGGLVKSVKFKDYKYVGDPINAVKIFNEKEVDEIVVLDISASAAGKAPAIRQIAEIASETFMPMGYGGGITRVDEIKAILYEGVEKVVINTAAFTRPALLEEGAKLFGSQSIVVSVDVKKTLLGKYRVFTESGKNNTQMDPVAYARRAEDHGAGEIMLTSIDRDGTYLGYDLDLIHKVASAVSVPVIACGGARNPEDFRLAVEAGASAVAAGSLFVFHGPHRAVLINFPSQTVLLSEVFQKIG